MKARRGAADGITATAHKLARVIFAMLKHGEAHVRQGMEDAEKKFREQKLNSLKKMAKSMGRELVQKPTLPQCVS